jgi:transcription termination factor Rho
MELIPDRPSPIVDLPRGGLLKSGTAAKSCWCPEELAKRHLLRRALADLSAVEATQFLIEKLQKTPSNAAFLASMVAPAPAAMRRFR